MVIMSDVDLIEGDVYSARDIRETFEKGRAGKGIEINYDDRDRRAEELHTSNGEQYPRDRRHSVELGVVVQHRPTTRRHQSSAPSTATSKS